ncbi:MAG: hypothetical protein NC401_19245, partial [Ruminococcus sp.]|nr:hypothetical protein [Ruminococcus sp.]
LKGFGQKRGVPQMIQKIKALLRSRKAYSAAPLAVVIALAGMMFFVTLWQIIRLITISAGVKDAVQSAVIATSVANYANVYAGVREGYSGGYRYSGNSWKTAISEGDVYGRLDKLLGLHSSGGKHTKSNSDGTEFAIYGLSVDVDNAQFAPTSGGIKQFSATSYITVEVPLSFCGEVLPPMKIRLCVKSKYTPKF